LREALPGFAVFYQASKPSREKLTHELLPLVEGNEWFFDAELLVLAEKLGYRGFRLARAMDRRSK
jgi:hypothetical protein